MDEFLLYDTGGALLWAGSGILAGVIFHRAIDRALAFLASIGSAAFAVLGGALAIFVAVKWWRRQLTTRCSGWRGFRSTTSSG